jgi:hypothetical protein
MFREPETQQVTTSSEWSVIKMVRQGITAVSDMIRVVQPVTRTETCYMPAQVISN